MFVFMRNAYWISAGFERQQINVTLPLQNIKIDENEKNERVKEREREGETEKKNKTQQQQQLLFEICKRCKVKLKEIMCRKFKFHLIYLIAVDNFPLLRLVSLCIHISQLHYGTWKETAQMSERKTREKVGER